MNNTIREVTPNTIDPALVAEVAGKLTKAQRAMVLTSDRGFAEQHRGKWNATSIVTARKVFAFGLTDRPVSLTFPTDLGIAVRRFLQEQQG